jgi:hypothetical protein
VQVAFLSGNPADGTHDRLATELDTVAGRLELRLDRLASAADPARAAAPALCGAVP